MFELLEKQMRAIEEEMKPIEEKRLLIVRKVGRGMNFSLDFAEKLQKEIAV